MYLYIHKIYENENEQTQLLEMCSDAGINFRNGWRFRGVTQNTQLKKRLQIEIFATFLFRYSTRN